jgi:hypothetical protein
MKGWLNKYNDNPNDSSVSLPEGFSGVGNNTQGRNFSPAWGGQFQNGGNIIFDPEGEGYDYVTADKYGISPDETGHWPSRVPETGQILKGQKHKTYNKTIAGEDKAGYKIHKGKDNKYYSQKKLWYDDILPAPKKGVKKTFLQPGSDKLPSADNHSEVSISIGGENGEPAYIIPSFKGGEFLEDPIREYRETGENLGGPFKTWQDAEGFNTERHKYVENGKQDIPTPLAHRNMQNGGEMRYYQEGLDFQSKGMEDGGWLAKYGDGGETTTDTTIMSPIKRKKIDFSKSIKDQPIEIKKDNTSVATVSPLQVSKDKVITSAQDEQKRIKIQAGNSSQKTVTTPEPQGIISKTWDILSHPATAAELLTKQGRIPDNFAKALESGNLKRNVLDMATDVVNPVALVDYASGIPKDIEEGNIGEALLKGASMIPLAKTALPTINKAIQFGKKVNTAGTSKMLDRYARGLEYKVEKNVLHTNRGEREMNAGLSNVERLTMAVPPIGNRVLANITKKIDDVAVIQNKFNEDLVNIGKKISYNRESDKRFTDLYKQQLFKGDITNKQFNFIADNPSYAAFLKNNNKLDDALLNIDKYINDDALVNEFQNVWKNSQRGVVLNNTPEELNKLKDAVTLGGTGRWEAELGRANYSSNSDLILDRFSTPHTGNQIGYQAQLEFNLPGLKEAATAKEKLAIINKHTAHDLNRNFYTKKHSPDTYVIETAYGNDAAERVISKKAMLENPKMLQINSIQKRVNEVVDPNVMNKVGQYGLKDATTTNKHFPYSSNLLIDLTTKQNEAYINALNNLPAEKLEKMRRIDKARYQELNKLLEQKDQLLRKPYHSRNKSHYEEVERNIQRLKRDATEEIQDVIKGTTVIGGGAGVIGGGIKTYVDYHKKRSDEISAKNEAFKKTFKDEEAFYSFQNETRAIIRAKTKHLKRSDREKYSQISKQVRKEIASKYQKEYKQGGVIKDNDGYWNPDNWGKPVKIGSNKITMKGVYEPLLGISDTGDRQMMYPGQDYQYEGSKVTEYPMAQDGKELQELNQLVNFTNYNKPQPGGWLQKYSKS